MTNEKIITCFINGIYAKNNNLLSSEGILWSYDMPIATLKNNKGVINDFSIDYIEKMTGYRSITTRQHLGSLKRAVNMVGNNEKIKINDDILEIVKPTWEIKTYE